MEYIRNLDSSSLGEQHPTVSQLLSGYLKTRLCKHFPIAQAYKICIDRCTKWCGWLGNEATVGRSWLHLQVLKKARVAHSMSQH